MMKTLSAWLFVLSGSLLSQMLSASEITTCGITPDPPANIGLRDSGFLGYLTIQWSRPDSLQNLTDCTVRYQLRYFDTYEERWRSVRTSRVTYAAQFDLEKPVRVRILTVLRCTCTNGTDVQGEETEMVYMFEPIGVAGSKIKDFQCVYYGREYMECTWEPGSIQPPNSQHSLFYWHREMEETKECPVYIFQSKVRRGCRFASQTLLEFSRFNMCVNGSSPEGILSTAFFSFEIQNYVKPAVVPSVRVLEAAELFKIHWEPPAGQVPEHCLDYEVESSTLMANGKEQKETKALKSIDLNTSCEILKEENSLKTCFRIRSKMNIYCADQGLWSDWSQAACIEEKEKDNTEAWDSHLLVLLIIITTGVILLSFSFWMLQKNCTAQKKRKELLFTLHKQKVNKSIPTLLSSVFK